MVEFQRNLCGFAYLNKAICLPSKLKLIIVSSCKPILSLHKNKRKPIIVSPLVSHSWIAIIHFSFQSHNSSFRNSWRYRLIFKYNCPIKLYLIFPTFLFGFVSKFFLSIKHLLKGSSLSWTVLSQRGPSCVKVDGPASKWTVLPQSERSWVNVYGSRVLNWAVES